MKNNIPIGAKYDGGCLDYANVTSSGVIRIVGWSTERNLSPPDLVGARHLWSLRFQRDDIPHPNAGVYHDFLIEAPEVTFGKHVLASRGQASKPPYAHMLDADTPLQRNQIYGTGPSVTFADSQLARLYEALEGKVLDFGCGSGAMVSHLRSKGVDATGIDLDNEHIKSAVLDEARSHVNFYDGSALPFQDREFDWVCASEVLEHIPYPQFSLTEMARVGKNLVITVPDATAIVRLSGVGVVPWHLLEATHVNFFTPRSLRNLLSEHYSDITIGQIHNTATEGDAWSVNLWAICRAGPVSKRLGMGMY